MDLPTWRSLPWDQVQSTADLLAMRARQLQRRDEDIEEAALYLRRSREQDKEEFDARKRLLTKGLNVGDLVLLHDTKLNAHLINLKNKTNSNDLFELIEDFR